MSTVLGLMLPTRYSLKGVGHATDGTAMPTCFLKSRDVVPTNTMYVISQTLGRMFSQAQHRTPHCFAHIGYCCSSGTLDDARIEQDSDEKHSAR